MRLTLAALLIGTAFPAAAQEFPQQFTTRFGTVRLDAPPERVVSLDFGGVDNLLALGVAPVAIRYWYGSDEFGVWDWAQDALGNQTPEVLRGEINIERIAALDPDVILAMASGITSDQYALLSRIAPVVAAPKGRSDYGTPWQGRARLAGCATGRLDEAEAQIEAIEARLAQAARQHPEWQGQSVAVAFHWNEQPGAYTSEDIRPQLFAELGFVTPEAFDTARSGNAFWAGFSSEDLSPLDTDLLVWLDDGEVVGKLKALALRKGLRAHREGRELYADEVLTAAFSHGSLLSLPYVIDEMLPLVEAAVDGDPATPVQSTHEAGLAP